MMKGLKRLAGGGLLLMELRGLRKEVARLATAQEQLLALAQAVYAQHYPVRTQPNPAGPVVEITHVNAEDQRLFMDIELRLTQATGQPPTEDEILEEYDRIRTTNSAVVMNGSPD